MAQPACAAAASRRASSRHYPGIVMGLQSFERALENMVQAVFSRSNRSTIRPVELGRRLLREMDDHRSVDVKGRRIVPNAFTFHLSPRDHAGFAEIDQALHHELLEAAKEYARDEGYHFIGPLSVDLVVDQALKPGRFGIASTMREEQVAASVPADYSSWAANDMPVVVEQAPAPVEIAAPAPPPAPSIQGVSAGRVQLPSGQMIEIGPGTVSIGRLPECTITLNDPNVSRRHAEIRPGNPIVIVDLGSTNGTKVNGLRIAGERVLTDGDIISLGSTHLRFEAIQPSA
ncbi:MAG: FhaA domain-containing protein [Ilumatobacteraceae bacterium]